MAKPQPQVAQIMARIFAEGLRTRDVLARAEVGRATWWRASKGEDVYLSTINRMTAAIDSLIAEKELPDGHPRRIEDSPPIASSE